MKQARGWWPVADSTLPLQGAPIQSLFGELRSLMPKNKIIIIINVFKGGGKGMKPQSSTDRTEEVQWVCFIHLFICVYGLVPGDGYVNE